MPTDCSNKINLVFTSHLTQDPPDLDVGLRRILLMTYFPSGFWSRIITRLLGDEQISEAIKTFYLPLNDVSPSPLVNFGELHAKFSILL